MATLRFNDGVEMNLRGKYRITKLYDGLYVVGHGMMEPVKDYAEAHKVLDSLKKYEKEEALEESNLSTR